MRRNSSRVGALFLIGAMIVTVASSGHESRAAASVPAIGGEYIEGEALVVLRSSAEHTLLNEGETVCGDDILVDDVMDFGTTHVAHVTSDEYSAGELISELKEEEDVVTVIPNRVVHAMDTDSSTTRTNDRYYDYQWALGGRMYSRNGSDSIGLHYCAEPTVSDVTAPVVAVVDQGISYDHEDLAENMWVNPYQSSGLSGTYGYDFVDDDSDPKPKSVNEYHGTHVAGIIAAKPDNSIGIAGVSGKTKLMSCRVLNEKGSGSSYSILKAFEYIYKAQTLGVKIAAVNCSFGQQDLLTALNSSEKKEVSLFNDIIGKIGSKGALLVFAAGNSSYYITETKKTFEYWYDDDYLVFVGATSANDHIASYSNYGEKKVDVFAPGTQILSTVTGYAFLPSVYTKEEREKNCLFYEDFSNGNTRALTLNDIKGSVYSAVTLSLDDRDYFDGRSFDDDFETSVPDGWCLGAEVGTSGENPSLEKWIYFNVDEFDIDVGRHDYYLAYDYMVEKSKDVEGSCWSHTFAKLKSSDVVKLFNKTYIKIDTTKLLGSSTSTRLGVKLLYDNISLSVADPDTSSWGRYSFLSGTSMAAPQVSGAIARLAVLYPKDSALTRKARLYAGVRKTQETMQKCKSGGIIDISMYSDEAVRSVGSVGGDGSTITPVTIDPNAPILVKTISLNKKSAKLRVGRKLVLWPTVLPENAANKRLRWKVSNKKYATVTQHGVVKALKKGRGHTVIVTASSIDGSGIYANCRIKIKK